MAFTILGPPAGAVEDVLVLTDVFAKVAIAILIKGSKGTDGG